MAEIVTQRRWRPSWAGMYAAQARIADLETDNDAKSDQIAALKRVIIELKVALSREMKRARKREANR